MCLYPEIRFDEPYEPMLLHSGFVIWFWVKCIYIYIKWAVGSVGWAVFSLFIMVVGMSEGVSR